MRGNFLTYFIYWIWSRGQKIISGKRQNFDINVIINTIDWDQSNIIKLLFIMNTYMLKFLSFKTSILHNMYL